MSLDTKASAARADTQSNAYRNLDFFQDASTRSLQELPLLRLLMQPVEEDPSRIKFLTLLHPWLSGMPTAKPERNMESGDSLVSLLEDITAAIRHFELPSAMAAQMHLETLQVLLPCHHSHPTLLERWLHTLLRHSKLKLSDPLLIDGGTTPELLRLSTDEPVEHPYDEWRHVHVTLIDAAPSRLDALSAAEDELSTPTQVTTFCVRRLIATDVTELQGWSPQALRSSLNLLQLHYLYSEMPRRVATHGRSADDCSRSLLARRLNRFETEGVGIWMKILAAAKTVFGDQPQADERAWGPYALRATHTRLSGATLFASSGIKDVLPQDAPRFGDIGHLSTVHIIKTDIPPGNDKSDIATIKRFELLRRQPLPLPSLPDVAVSESHCRMLKREFPWAHDAIDHLGRQLILPRRYGSLRIGWTPLLLLVGPPGCGKSRLARRWAELLKMPWRVLNLGNSSDSRGLTGTSRGWASGQPSPLLEMMLSSQCGAGVVIADELDKTRPNPQTPSPFDSLLALLEPENSQRFTDIFLQAPCDMSHLCWILTANQTGNIPGPLLSRLDVKLVPQPTAEQMCMAVPGLLHELERTWGLPAGTLPTLDTSSAKSAIKNLRQLRSWVLDELGLLAEAPTQHRQ